MVFVFRFSKHKICQCRGHLFHPCILRSSACRHGVFANLFRNLSINNMNQLIASNFMPVTQPFQIGFQTCEKPANKVANTCRGYLSISFFYLGWGGGVRLARLFIFFVCQQHFAPLQKRKGRNKKHPRQSEPN